jgi:mono/diheme cytochrome c family protein
MGLIARALALAFVMAFGAGAAAWPAQDPASPRTTRDRVYAKDQADRGETQYASLCAKCHDPAKLQPGKKPGPVLVGDAFLAKWEGRTLGELMTGIQTTMPNDGSAFLSMEESVDLVAYLVRANGFPDGPAPLGHDDASREILIAKR